MTINSEEEALARRIEKAVRNAANESDHLTHKETSKEKKAKLEARRKIEDINDIRIINAAFEY